MAVTVAEAQAPSIDALSQYDGVRLFVDRARQVRPNFRLSADNGPAVAGICERLDGIPLAIELAAARCRSLSPGQILDGLADGLIEAVASAVQQAVTVAVQEAVRSILAEVLTNPDLLAKLMPVSSVR